LEKKLPNNIIIIGGGIVGASFAYHAHLFGIDNITIVTDSLPGDKEQATSNTWGWVNGYATNDKKYADFRLANLQYWKKLIKEIDNLKPTSKGAFFWDMSESELHKTVEQHKNWGHAVKKFTKLEIDKHLPKVSSRPKIAGFGESDLAIEGSKATLELIKASGAEIKKDNVQKLIYENNHVRGVKTKNRIIFADEVIITAGLGTSDLLSSININFKMRSSLGLLAYTNLLPPLLNYPITGINFHARQNYEGRLVIGGTFDEDASKENNIRKAAEKLVEDMALRLKYNDHMTLDYFTLGERPITIDGRPKIGRINNQMGKVIKGVYVAVMHSGITNAPLAGKLGIAEIIDGKRNFLLSDFLPQKITDNKGYH